MATIPTSGKFYSPYKDGNEMVLQLVNEDEEFWFFSDKTKYSKSIPFYWFEVEAPTAKIELNEVIIWPYESYSLWSRQIAMQMCLNDIIKELAKCEQLSEIYAIQHLAAINATTSMQSQSQRRAHARNNLTSNYEKKRALRDAIEIYEHYPQHVKK